MDRLTEIKKLEDSYKFHEGLHETQDTRRRISRKLEQEIKTLNEETDWIQLVGTKGSFEENVKKLENDFPGFTSFQKKEILKISLDKLKATCDNIIAKNDIWKYCSDKNLQSIIKIQNYKLSYLKDSFKIIGIYVEGLDNIYEFNNQSYRLIELTDYDASQIHETDEEKRTSKLKIAILYRLGIIDHLQKFDSLKDNDSALSRVLASFLGGRKDTFQPYISAAKNNPKSSSVQNNPVSQKLIEKANDILFNSGMNLKDFEG